MWRVQRPQELLGPQPWKGALHFAGRWRGWKEGLFLASCASAGTAGILLHMWHSSLAHQIVRTSLCTTNGNQQPLSLQMGGRKEELPGEHFFSHNSLWLMQTYDTLWRPEDCCCQGMQARNATKAGSPFPAYCLVRMGTFLAPWQQFGSKRPELSNVPSSGMSSGVIQQTGKGQATPRNKTSAERWQNSCWLRTVFSWHALNNVNLL